MFKRKIPGAKIVLYQLNELNLCSGDLKEWFPDARFLVLYRKNLAEQFLSLKVAAATRWWDSYHENHTTLRFALDPSELEVYIRLTKAEYREALKDSKVRSDSAIVQYEALARNPTEIFHRTIFPFLHIHSTDVRPGTVKVLRRPPSDFILNYSAVQTYFEGSAGHADISNILTQVS